MKFISKPCVVEATQWNAPGDHPAVFKTISGHLVRGKQGLAAVNPGDWIIEEPNPEDGYYPCHPEVFALKYDAIGDPASWSAESEQVIKDLFAAGFNHAEMRA